MFTEEEAKKKWCPNSAVESISQYRMEDGTIAESGYSFNRHRTGEIPEGAFCLASECHYWRWNEFDYLIGTEKDNPGDGWKPVNRREIAQDATTEAHIQITWQRPKTGFCGIAGKP